VELGHKESFIESLERAIYRPFVAFLCFVKFVSNIKHPGSWASSRHYCALLTFMECIHCVASLAIPLSCIGDLVLIYSLFLVFVNLRI